MQTQQKERLAQLVRDEVKVQMRKYAMARTREAFIESLVDELSPALDHHYRALLGTLNRRTDQVAKWQEQQEGFLNQFAGQLVKPTKSGLDVDKAIKQALKEVMQKDDARRRIETAKFARSYQLTKIVPLHENAHEELFEKVWEIVHTMFPSHTNED
jgi:hypothetical protein